MCSMTVQQLIDELNKVEDKSLEVVIYNREYSDYDIVDEVSIINNVIISGEEKTNLETKFLHIQ